MSIHNEREKMMKEIEGILQEYGLSSFHKSRTKLSPNDFRKIREIADGIIHGNINKDEISKLGKDLTDELSTMVTYLISLRGSGRVRELQEMNPYYSSFGSKIVRDSIKKGA